jgi:tetratricopeptide (TPR) repeat protein
MEGKMRFSEHVNLQFVLYDLIFLFLLSIQLSGSPQSLHYLDVGKGNIVDIQGRSLKDIRLEIAGLRYQNNIQGILSLADSLVNSVNSNDPVSSYSADIYYYAGVCELVAAKNNSAARWLKQSVLIKQNLAIRDTNYAKALYNLGIVYTSMGDFDNTILYTKEYIDCAAILFGENSPDVA